MLKAASLTYAIFISLIISVLCYALLLIFSLNLNLTTYFNNRGEILDHNRAALVYLEGNYPGLESSFNTTIFQKDDLIEAHYQISTWGLFEKWEIVSKTKKNDISRHFLISSKRKKMAPAIYLRDNGNELKIAGKTRIEGDIIVSDRGLKKVTISGNSGFYDPVHLGKVLQSEKQLPETDEFTLNYPETFNLSLIEDFREPAYTNTFDKITRVIEVGSKLENISLKGNIILRSKDTLHILNTATLEDIIIDAPKIVFHSGFKGNIQAFASSEIIVERDVKLDYPSVLIVSSDNMEIEKKIVCGEDSHIKGAVIIKGNGIQTENKNRIIIDETASVTGEVFCDGKLSLYGTVHGSVYTSSFFHKTHSTTYDNLLFNAYILNDLPEGYFRILQNDTNDKPEAVILKKL